MQELSPREYARGLTEWLQHCARNDDAELTLDGQVASELFAECNIGLRLLLESMRK